MPSSSKRSYGPRIQGRVKGFLRVILEAVEGQRGLSQDKKLEFSWSEDGKTVTVETTLRAIVQFRYPEIQYHSKAFKRAKSQAGEALKDLRDFVGILVDHRIKKRGSDEWRFSLNLWGQRIERNLEEFDKLWESKRSPISKHNLLTERQPNPPFNPLFPERHWNVPYDRNAFFTGRNQILTDLHKRLSQDNTAAFSQTHAISGLGGIGKTQTVVEYAYQYNQNYQAVFWVRSETQTDIKKGFVDIAKLLDLPHKDAQDPNETIEAVKCWLEENSNWLLIFDNVDDPILLKQFRPQRFKGHILLTSRTQVLGVLGIANPLILDKMQPQEALEFLFKRTGYDHSDLIEQGAATHLAEELDYLPLALEQAGAYIQEQQVRFQDYLTSYSQHRLSLLEKSGSVASDYPESVATTWDLNFQQVETESMAAGDILRVSAFCCPDAIPYELLKHGAIQLGNNIATALKNYDHDPLILNELLTPLARYSLIRREFGNQVYSVNRLIQEVMKARMDAKTCSLWKKRVFRALVQTFPDPEDYANWPQCDRLLSHARYAIQAVDDYQPDYEVAVLLLTRTGSYLRERVQYSEAEHLCLKAVKICEHVLCKEHRYFAESLKNLARVYDVKGLYNQAEPLYLKALEINTCCLGEDHPDVAININDLATVYCVQGRYSEAEPLLIKTLEFGKLFLEEAHPSLATSYFDLAGFYRSQGRYSDAEFFCNKSLELRQKNLGKMHPDVANSLCELAKIYHIQGRFRDAEDLYKTVLKLRKKILGEDHPDVAASLCELARIYRDKGYYKNAEDLFLDALNLRKILLGKKHPDVAESLNNLANLYFNQGRYSDAEPLYINALELRMESCGEMSLDVTESLNNLAALFQEQGKYSDAKKYYIKALKVGKHLLGEEHPDIAKILSNLAGLFQDQGDFCDAESLYNKALDIQKIILGDKHPDVATNLNNLAILYCSQNRFYEARINFEKALIIFEENFEYNYEKIDIIRNNINRLDFL